MSSPVNRRTFLAGASGAVASLATGAIGVPGAFGGVSAAQAAAPSTYTASWASVDQHPPAPGWFSDAKFGIYYHWGAFSVPAFHNEWYPRDMYVPNSSIWNHHVAVYGDPITEWPYQNFLTGARDKAGNFVQFAPKLTSAGGNWDPNEWAQIFKDAGAKFAGPVAEHHDGYSMWNSAANEWNSVRTGPKLDLLKLHGDAIRGQGMRLLVAMHHAFHFNGYYQYVPAQSDPSLKKLFGQLGSTAENQLWYDKLKEVIDQSKPDIIWQDFDLNLVAETQRLNFLSYYYNQANAWGKEVVATFKDGFDSNGEVYDYERGGPAAVTKPYWLTDDSVSGSSWCYTTGMSYYSGKATLHSFIDRVSKNGNLLLNIAPIWDGTIPPEQRDILSTMGTYLKQAGESIYSTRAWTVAGEGPTSMGGVKGGPKAGTNKDIRFTRSRDRTVLYATALGYPSGGSLDITTLRSGRFSLSNLKSVQLLGSTAGTYIPVGHTQNSSALHITLPVAAPYSALAYAVKLTFTGAVPTLQ